MTDSEPAIVIVGTFDSKPDEHRFLRKAIEENGLPTRTMHVGTLAPSPFPVDLDLFREVLGSGPPPARDRAIAAVIHEARSVAKQWYGTGLIRGMISAGGGTGTHICTSIRRTLPLGIPKVMVSTVASRDMSQIVGTSDIAMIHSVVDLLGINSVWGGVLSRAAGAVCGMARSRWRPQGRNKRVALTMFGFITEAALLIREELKRLGHEVIAFHANGTGGMAMEKLAAEGLFHGILDLATHEFADELTGGYCRGIGPERLRLPPGLNIPRLVIPGGLDCAVVEFTRKDIPSRYRGRKIFFYDFRSAVRLSTRETTLIAQQVAERINPSPETVKVLIPMGGWSEADRQGGPLYDPQSARVFLERLERDLDPRIEVRKVEHHINEQDFAREAARLMDQMLRET